MKRVNGMEIKKVKITDNTKKFIQAKDDAVERSLIIIGGKGEKYAKALCPVGTPESTGIPGYVGGRLRNSITYATHTEHSSGSSPAEAGDYALHGAVKKGTVVIGTNVEYGPYVELGTIKMKARPYLRPAIVDHLQEFGHIIKNEFKKA